MKAQYALWMAIVAAVCFVLGWLVARQSWHEPAPAPPPVDIRIDAGGVELLPDGGLHLRPIPPLDLEADAG